MINIPLIIFCDHCSDEDIVQQMSWFCITSWFLHSIFHFLTKILFLVSKFLICLKADRVSTSLSNVRWLWTKIEFKQRYSLRCKEIVNYQSVLKRQTMGRSIYYYRMISYNKHTFESHFKKCYYYIKKNHTH